MNASRSFHVIAAKRRHSFPPIWLKMTLVNLPSAVRRAALARTPVATLAVIFGRLAAAFAFVTFLVVFFMIASLLWTGALPLQPVLARGPRVWCNTRLQYGHDIFS